jgi:hypothetical protein
MDEATWDHEHEQRKLVARARLGAREYLRTVNTNAIEIMYVNEALDVALNVLRPYIVVPPPPQPRKFERVRSFLESRRKSHGS